MNIADFAVHIADEMQHKTLFRLFGQLHVVQQSEAKCVLMTEVYLNEKRFFFIEAGLDKNTELGELRSMGDKVTRVFLNGTPFGVVINNRFFDWNFQQDELRRYRHRKLQHGKA